MLSELKLSNFRLFDDEVSVRFKPITVLIGRNSSGKSTILKFLLMLKQSAVSNSEDFPVVYGDFVQMGDFTELKNVLSEKENLEFELSFTPSSLEGTDPDSEFSGGLTDVARRNVLFSLQGRIPYLDNPLKGEITYFAGPKDPPKKNFKYVTSIENDSFFHRDALAIKVNELQKLLHSITESSSSEKDRYAKRSISSMRDDIITTSIGSELQKGLRSAFHLPPLRGELSRLIDFSEITEKNVDKVSAETLSSLRRILRRDSETEQFLLPHLINVAGIRSIGFEDDAQDGTRLFAENKDTGAKVLIADFGFGVSQCLPILVRGTTMSPETYLMIEQPEAQLHPTAQLHLGSFFSELWTERKVGSIIETHSYNLLLRLRRLIARGDLSHQDVSVAFFTYDEESRYTPIVRNLDIYEDGSMQEGLPIEFFAKDIEEGLKLGMRE